MKNELLAFIAQILVLIGGINWGFVGLFNVNLVSGILGEMIGRLVFIIVGVAAVYLIYIMYVDKMKKSV